MTAHDARPPGEPVRDRAGPYPVAVLAGGLGTRIRAVAGDMPKVLLPVAGRPFLDFKLAGLAEQGVRRAVLLLGRGAEAVAAHVGDGGRWGLEASHLVDGPVLLGTGGALRRALPLLGPVFWVTYGDTYLRVSMSAARAAFEAAAPEALTVVLRNRDRWDRSNMRVDGGLVTEYRKGAAPGTFDHIEYGLSLLRAATIEAFPPGPLELADVLQALVARRALRAFPATRRFYEIGTPDGWRQTDAWFRRGEAARLATRIR